MSVDLAHQSDLTQQNHSSDAGRASLAEKLFAPIDIGMIVLFRVAFGAALVIEMYRYFTHGWIDREFVDPPLHFTYYGFWWVRPLPGIGTHCMFALFGVSAACVVLGLCYRLSSIVLFICAAYVFLIEQALYLNHFYLIVLLCGISIFLPANRAYSLDAKIWPEIQSWTAPAWTLWLLRLQLGIVYFYGGLAKIDPDWLSGVPMQMMMFGKSEMPIVGQYFENNAMVLAYAWAGMLFDLAIVPLLMWKRTQTAAYAMVVLFHMSNARMFNIGIFPLVMVMVSLLFFPPEMMRSKQRDDSEMEPRNPSGPLTSKQRLTLALLGVYVSFQLLFPFRHFLYPGDNSWTEQGQRFAWRMKLRVKKASAQFHGWNQSGEEITDIPQPDEILTARQARIMPGRPDMILQYAHFLADDLEKRGYSGVRVTVDTSVSLNGRERQAMIAPDVNLAATSRNLWPADWILPLETPRPSLEEVRQKLKARAEQKSSEKT